MIVSKLDASQIQKMSFDETNRAMRNISIGGKLVPEVYSAITLTYDGAGNIATVTYLDGSTTIAQLTLGYDGSNRLISVSKA